MIFFHEQFPDVASKEMLAFKVAGHCQKCIPDGLFYFLELYCDNPKCDCDECLIEVCKMTDNGEVDLDRDVVASLKISWSGNGKSGYKVTLLKDIEQSQHAKYFYDVLKKHMTQQGNLAKIKKHYRLIKKLTKQPVVHL